MLKKEVTCWDSWVKGSSNAESGDPCRVAGLELEGVDGSFDGVREV